MLVTEEFLESSGALNVKALELGAEASRSEPIVDSLVRGKDGGTRLVGHGLSMDGVAVIVIQDEQLLSHGRCGEEEGGQVGMGLLPNQMLRLRSRQK
jgi:hypothetical protein